MITVAISIFRSGVPVAGGGPGPGNFLTLPNGDFLVLPSGEFITTS